VVERYHRCQAPAFKKFDTSWYEDEFLVTRFGLVCDEAGYHSEIYVLPLSPPETAYAILKTTRDKNKQISLARFGRRSVKA
jgi:hypothetical protein